MNTFFSLSVKTLHKSVISTFPVNMNKKGLILHTRQPTYVAEKRTKIINNWSSAAAGVFLEQSEVKITR